MNEERQQLGEPHIPHEWTTDLRRIARVSPKNAGWGGKDIMPSEGVRVYVGAALFAALFIGVVTMAPPVAPSGAEVAAVAETESAPPDPATYFSDLSIRARAAYVFDASNDTVLFEKNGEAQLPLASLTKVMTGLLAAERLSPDEDIVVPPEAIASAGDWGMLVDSRYALPDLLAAVLAASVNDGAVALAASAPEGRQGFINGMNAKATELGLAQTYFLNETGLDVELNVSGGYGSARDMAHLFAYALEEKPEIFVPTTREKISIFSKEGVPMHLTNTNKALSAIPLMLGSKTGFTDLAGGNLVIAFDFDFGRPVVVVVLGSTEEGRFTDAIALQKAARVAMKEMAEENADVVAAQ